jgi:hypothetical protein
MRWTEVLECESGIGSRSATLSQMIHSIKYEQTPHMLKQLVAVVFPIGTAISKLVVESVYADSVCGCAEITVHVTTICTLSKEQHEKCV